MKMLVARKFLLHHALAMDNVCNSRLFSIPSKVEMAEQQEYLCSQLSCSQELKNFSDCHLT